VKKVDRGRIPKKYIKTKLQFWSKFKAYLYPIMPKNGEKKCKFKVKLNDY
jgi:hypothetical protein